MSGGDETESGAEREKYLMRLQSSLSVDFTRMSGSEGAPWQPNQYAGVSTCFRKELAAQVKMQIFRVHQFESGAVCHFAPGGVMGMP